MTGAPSNDGSEQASLPTGAPVLDVSRLSVEFHSEGRWLRVVEDVTFSVAHAEVLGLVGESGSGKTVTSLAVMGLIDRRNGRVHADQISFLGQDLLGATSGTLHGLRGRDMAMIFQEPSRSLNPAFTVGDQIAEVVRRHTGASRRDAWSQAVTSLEQVGIRDARARARDYPFMFSGGMCQRVMIAMALVCGPKLLIADEPTTALDVTVQRQILDLLLDIRDRTGIAILLITHDLGVVADMCDRVAVMYAGQVVETGDIDDVFERPQHPYTEGLLGALPDPRTHTGRFGTIPGRVPPPSAWPSGCRFAPRCAHAEDLCRIELPLLTRASKLPLTLTRCHREAALHLRGVDGG